MIINLISENNIKTITLPKKCMGQFSFYEDNSNNRIVSIEAVNKKWVLRGHNNSFIDDNTNRIELDINTKVNIKYKNKYYIIYTMKDSADYYSFKKYSVNNGDFFIGTDDKNDIVIENKYISRKHARLSLRNNIWKIYDENSKNGVFVNGSRVSEKILEVGDCIYIMGVKIIIGTSFIKINSYSDFHVNEDVLIASKDDCPYYYDDIEEDSDDLYNMDEDELEGICYEIFSRSPRVMKEIDEKTFTIDAPPDSFLIEETPTMLLLGPSITMGMASIATGTYAVGSAVSSGDISSAIPSIVMSVSMLLGTMAWPIATKMYDNKRKKEKEALRYKEYKAYLKEISKTIDKECAWQREILKKEYIDINKCISNIEKKNRHLWERTPRQKDFLILRVGLGKINLKASIRHPEKRFALKKDELMNMLWDYCNKEKIIKDVPITYSLYKDYISGIVGKKSHVTSFLKGLLIQMVSYYSYDEVKLVFISNNKELINEVKWLPHVWTNDKKFRYIASNDSEVKELSSYFEKIIDERSKLEESKLKKQSPYYVIFVDNNKNVLDTDILRNIYKQDKNIGFSLIHFFDEYVDLPKECSVVIDLMGGKARLLNISNELKDKKEFYPDIMYDKSIRKLCVDLSNCRLKLSNNALRLPSMITFLEMFQVGKIEHLNILSRWLKHDPTKSLETEIGINTKGDTFKLDLHEKFHGPHGLIAGMTGSGKSEFIMTFILSMAVNFHPNEVSFVLIDYKGGGMAKAFKDLPHTVGIITNLDGSELNRSLVSIDSELKKRQKIFSKVSAEFKTSNIDIYKYQSMYRQGLVKEPMSQLFIICDEFAELKKEQTEFMDELISAARIGRSLGVHLILATQKPSGIVDDQIWSNSRFRVCLKVQDREDSNEVIKRPDAAMISETGRFYLQVGYNELFDIGQSAYAGAKYIASDMLASNKEKVVSLIDNNGYMLKQSLVSKDKTSKSNNNVKQIDAITNYLNDLANSEDIRLKPLWLPAIPNVILLDDLKKKYNHKEKEYILNALIGEYDYVTNQEIKPLTVPITNEGNVVIYGLASSGKTSFINALIYSLITEHSPKEVNIYILDYASESLQMFKNAPHVAGVLLADDSHELDDLIDLLTSQIVERKKILSIYGADYKTYISTSDEKMPNIVVVINNMAMFKEINEDKMDVIKNIIRDGSKYGIYTVVTANATNELDLSMKNSFKQRYTLELNEACDYMDVLGRTDNLLPKKCLGRGLVERETICEYQVGRLTDEDFPSNFVRNLCIELGNKYKDDKIAKIESLPKEVDASYLIEYIDRTNLLNLPIGVGYDSKRVSYFDFSKNFINWLFAFSDDYRYLLEDVASFMSIFNEIDIKVIDASNSIDNKNKKIEYFSDEDSIKEAIISMYETILDRNNTLKDAISNNTDIPKYKPTVLFINSINSLGNLLSKIDNNSKDKEFVYNQILLQTLTEINAKYDFRINYNVVIAENNCKMHMGNASEIVKMYSNTSINNAIWLGDSISSSFILDIKDNVKAKLDAHCNNNYGYVIDKDFVEKIKVLSSKDWEN